MASSITSQPLLPPPLLPFLDSENNNSNEEEQEEEEEEVQLQRQHGRKPAPGFHPSFVDHADEMRKSGNESYLRGEFVKVSQDEEGEERAHFPLLLLSSHSTSTFLTRPSLSSHVLLLPSRSRSPPSQGCGLLFKRSPLESKASK
jgi:hypothetical protein